MDVSDRSGPGDSVDALAHAVVGAAIEVHRTLGPGYLESVYEHAMCVELTSRRIPFVCQARFDIKYKNVAIGEGRLDLLIDGDLIVEPKAVESLAPIHHAQALSYLKATGKRLALLINFNEEVLKHGIKRVVL